MASRGDRVRSVYCTHSILGAMGVGGPGAHLFQELRESFAPAFAVAIGVADPAIPPEATSIVPAPLAARLVRGTRLERFVPRPQAAERRRFDRRAARAVPPCDVAILENSTALLTMARLRRDGARILLKYNNQEFSAMSAEVDEERRRWGGPAYFLDEEQIRISREEVRGADLVFAVSELVLRGLEGVGVPRAKLRRARYGVDTERFVPSTGRTDGFTVGFVGWLALYKGFPYLVEGFRDAGIRGSTLLLHGGTGIEHYHRLVESLRGGADVRIVRGPVQETYAKSAVTVLPSVSDAFGNVVLESMACGVPVIVSDHCGAAAEVRDGVDGFVIPARDAGAIRDRLLLLHGDPDLRARMGRAAREAAVARPWARFREDVRGLVAECLGSGG